MGARTNGIQFRLFLYIWRNVLLNRLASAWANGTSAKSAFCVKVNCPQWRPALARSVQSAYGIAKAMRSEEDKIQ